jgi:nucleotide-binding universal stress UspA family protein
MAPFRKILVATDFSPDAERALAIAVDMARAFTGTVTLLHVCQMPAYAFFNGGMYAPTPELVHDIVEDAKGSLAAAAARMKERLHGVTLQTAWLEGEPAGTIVRFAEEQHVDLVVMGTHGRRGFRRWVMGSVAEHVVRTAPCPVLTVHAPEAEPALQGAA